MSIGNSPIRYFYVGDGTTTAFGYGSPFVAPANLVVINNGVTMVLNTDYTIAPNQDSRTFNYVSAEINFVVAPLAASIVQIYRSTPPVQSTQYTNGGVFPSNATEATLDQLVMIEQENEDQLKRSISYPQAEMIAGTTILPAASARASKVLGFDSSGNLSLTAVTLGTWRGNYAAATAYNFEDFFKDPVTGNIYVALVAYTSVSIAVDLAALNIALLIQAPTTTIVMIADYGVDGGSANAYVVTASGSITSLTAGQRISFLPGHACTGASTINVNALGVKNIQYQTTTGLAALASGMIQANQLAVVEYDGTQFQLLNPIIAQPPTFDIYLYATAAGTNAYTATVPAFTYTAGALARLQFTNANSSAATLNVNSLGAVAIQWGGVALTAGQISAGWIADLIFDGTQFQILQVVPAVAVVGASCIMQEQKASGTASAFTCNNAFQKRQLNTKVNDLSSLVSLNTSTFQFVPVSGSYRVSGWATLGVSGGAAKLKIRNITAGTDVVLGGSQLAGPAATGQLINNIDGVFTANGTDSFALEHFCTQNSSGGTYPTSQGVEVYASLTMVKIA